GSGEFRPLPDEIFARERDLPPGFTAELVEHCTESAGVAPRGEWRVVVIIVDAASALPALRTRLQSAQAQVGSDGLGDVGICHGAAPSSVSVTRSSLIVPAWIRTTCRCSGSGMSASTAAVTMTCSYPAVRPARRWRRSASSSA